LKEAEEILKKVYSEIPNYEDIIKEILSNGITNDLFEKCHLTPGFSVKPMLAKRVTSVEELFTKFGEKNFTCEFKVNKKNKKV
jgi:DNA ligase 1